MHANPVILVYLQAFNKLATPDGTLFLFTSNGRRNGRNDILPSQLGKSHKVKSGNTNTYGKWE